MDQLTFASNAVTALAWPGTVVVLVSMFRGPIAEIIPLITKVKYKDLEVDIDHRLQQATESAAALPMHKNFAVSAVAARPQLVQMAQTTPRQAILEAWNGVESATRAAADSANVPPVARLLQSPSLLLQALGKAGVVEPSQASLFQDLLSVRNTAVHLPAFEPSEAAASQFVSLANELEQSLKVPAPAK